MIPIIAWLCSWQTGKSSISEPKQKGPNRQNLRYWYQSLWNDNGSTWNYYWLQKNIGMVTWKQIQPCFMAWGGAGGNGSFTSSQTTFAPSRQWKKLLFVVGEGDMYMWHKNFQNKVSIQSTLWKLRSCLCLSVLR